MPKYHYKDKRYCSADGTEGDISFPRVKYKKIKLINQEVRQRYQLEEDCDVYDEGLTKKQLWQELFGDSDNEDFFGF